MAKSAKLSTYLMEYGYLKYKRERRLKESSLPVGTTFIAKIKYSKIKDTILSTVLSKEEKMKIDKRDLERREERKSVTEARMYRQVTKSKAFSVGNKRIDHLICLLDRKVLLNTEGKYRAPTKREVIICKLYPHMALAYYISGPENGTKHKFYVGLSVADLIETGILNCTHGNLEVRA